jgi:TPR repeat protein
VRRDYDEARKLLELAAKAGDSLAQSNLGYLYDRGLGVVQDYALAAHWYHLAAENGNPLGQNNLADLLLLGQGARQSYQEAFHWFEMAAQQGHTGARIDLGFLLMNGLGAAKDPVAALRFDPRCIQGWRSSWRQLSSDAESHSRSARTGASHAAGTIIKRHCVSTQPSIGPGT